jgi:aspartate oxidase
MKIIPTDCLVLGAGLAGSAYALHAARAGLKVELLSLGAPLAANSDWAQGGIIYDTAPDPAQLAADIFAASDGTANAAAVAQLVREGPGAVRELLLDELHVEFDRDAGGRLDLAREGGHSARRIIHAKDATGHAILGAAVRRVDATPGITRRSSFVAVDLLTLSHSSTRAGDRYEPLTCFGCYALDTASGEVIAFVAKKTVLATGGLGGIFLHSTNQPGSVGHGVAMAYRVGARLIDLEYVQFHPTVFLKPGLRCAGRGRCSSMRRAGGSWTRCTRSAPLPRGTSSRARSSSTWPRPARPASGSTWPRFRRNSSAGGSPAFMNGASRAGWTSRANGSRSCPRRISPAAACTPTCRAGRMSGI